MLTQSSAGQPPQLLDSLPAQRTVVRPAGDPPPVESGPQRAVREAEERFRELLAEHIEQMHSRGVCTEVLTPFRRELQRLSDR